MKVQSILGQKESNIQVPALEQNDSVIMGDQDFKCFDFINSMPPLKRKKLINSLVGNEDHNSIYVLNELILFESRSILNNRGHNFTVRPGVSCANNLGACNYNSITSTVKGYNYVEGYVKQKGSGDFIALAWNADFKGNHVDFTYNNTETFDYFGLVIPLEIIFKIGLEKNLNVHAILPFYSEEMLSFL